MAAALQPDSVVELSEVKCWDYPILGHELVELTRQLRSRLVGLRAQIWLWRLNFYQIYFYLRKSILATPKSTCEAS
jgi:hypothetical protein